MPQSSVAGSYTTKRDNCLTYTYEARWAITGNRLIWDSEVKRNGEWKGTPGGNLDLSPHLDVAITVIKLIGATIEDLVGVER